MCPSFVNISYSPNFKIIWFDEKLLCYRAPSLGQKLHEVFNSERYLFSEAIVWSCSGQFVHQFHKTLHFTESLEYCIPIVTIHLTCSSFFTCLSWCGQRLNWLFSRILGTFHTKHELLGLPLRRLQIKNKMYFLANFHRKLWSCSQLGRKFMA